MRTGENGLSLVVLSALVWMVAGAPRLTEIFGALEISTGALPWLVLYVAFGFCIALALSARSDRAALAWTLVQSALALALLAFGMPHFEGALLALVGAQTRLVVPLRIALAWISLQALPLFVAILPSHELAGGFKATLEYAAFASFAAVLFDLRAGSSWRRSMRSSSARAPSSLRPLATPNSAESGESCMMCSATTWSRSRCISIAPARIALR